MHDAFLEWSSSAERLENQIIKEIDMQKKKKKEKKRKRNSTRWILLVSFALCMVGDGTHRDVLIYMDWITRALKKTMSGKRPNSGKLFFWVCLLYERRRKIHVFTHRNRFTILVNRTTRLNYYILLTCRKM